MGEREAMGLLSFDCVSRDGDQRRSVEIAELVIAGWTGRDTGAMEAHIAELAALGVTRPSATPLFYRAGASLLTTAPSIDVVGNASSGEVEPVLVSLDDGFWVGVGSDHTDRKVEAAGVAISKQLCPKPIAASLWRFADVAAHWDELVLQCFAIDGDGRRAYQEGTAARMRRPQDLIARYCGNGEALPVGTAMFCGTMPVIGKIKPAGAFELVLEDPVLGRTIRHTYAVRPLPVVA